VDFDARTLTVRDTKNRQDHVLPLPNYLFETLTRRRQSTEDSEFVLPGNGRHGFLIDPRRQMACVTAESGVPFTLHDLRRTFATAADSLNMSGYAVKRLLNHKLHDVTAGYVISDVERLREPMQTIEDYLLRSAGIHGTAKVISIHRDMEKVG
jgi:integrase